MGTKVYSAIMPSQSVSTADDPLIELQLGSNVSITILRAWIGAAEGTDPVAEVQEVEIYSGPNVGTAGTALTEQPLSDQEASSVTALRNLTDKGAGSFALYRDGFHLQNGWLYLPVPEERITLVGGSADPGDNIGISFPVAPDAAITISAGITWAEIS